MEFQLREGEEFIPINTLMKLLRWVESGGQAHAFIAEGMVQLNGEVVHEKRKKVRAGDTVSFHGQEANICA